MKKGAETLKMKPDFGGAIGGSVGEISWGFCWMLLFGGVFVVAVVSEVEALLRAVMADSLSLSFSLSRSAAILNLKPLSFQKEFRSAPSTIVIPPLNSYSQIDESPLKFQLEVSSCIITRSAVHTFQSLYVGGVHCFISKQICFALLAALYVVIFPLYLPTPKLSTVGFSSN